MSKSQAQKKSTIKKVTGHLRRTLFSCFSATKTTSSSSTTNTTTTTTTTTMTKNRVSFSFPDLFRGHHAEQPPQEPQEEDSFIDASAASETPPHHHRRRRRHQGPPPTPSRSVIVGTIFGRRRGRVSFCVQRDPAVPPPFLFELSIPTHALAAEMHSGLLRVALECNRCTSSSAWCRSSAVWKAYCNGRKVGYAVRRRPTEIDSRILESVRLISAGAGVLCPAEEDKDKAAKEGELMYMRATYERVVGSRDSVSYHLINPGGGASGSPPQELSVFLLRTG
ncbi:Protein MIZU-KUSSEI 1 [Ananas comosus]|uniref:Protein MIZU-KUSSEI 1 n=1 Tax=Ananas comosus TaxID=4615 RepID=A0A199W821_ANACO|nr:Protein MIZU-KUSSEI 1 [Ananas comosus]